MIKLETLLLSVGGSRLPYGNTMEVYVQLISREDLGNNPIH